MSLIVNSPSTSSASDLPAPASSRVAGSPHFRAEEPQESSGSRRPGSVAPGQVALKGESGRAGRRYCLITPCRDEEEFAEATLRSVSLQTEPPALWIIVDDGSTDRTPQILREWQQKLPYLRVIARADRGERKLGGGVIEAFNDGLATINPADFDYLCKFDLDLDIPPNYFAEVMNVMEADPRLAVFSGKPYFYRGGKLTSEMCGDENAVGMIKFYRVPAFEQIGGFVREVMWDGIDGHRCRMLGWRAESRDDPKLRFVHLRPMGTSHKSWWTGRARHGRGQYFMGTGPVYMLASAIYRMSRPPRIVGGIAMLWGYFSSWLTGARRYADPEFRRFLRKYQWRCLLMGKRLATRRLDAEQSALFRPPVETRG